jgi:hypothetical protein
MCALNVKCSKSITIIQKGESPLSVGVVTQSQASGKVANREVRTEVSQTAVSVLMGRLAKQQGELHIEAMRTDEVAHSTEVQSYQETGNQFRNSRCSSDRYKDI